MAGFLKQSTEVTHRLGPYVDKTDGVTEETGLAGAGTEISKAGGAFATGPTLGTHDAEGWYPVTLTTTHTNTLGSLKIKGHDSATHLPVWDEWTVVPAAVYDSLVAGSDTLPADVTQWNGTNVTTPRVAGSPEVILGNSTSHGGGSAQVQMATSQLGAVTATTIDASGAVSISGLMHFADGVRMSSATNRGLQIDCSAGGQPAVEITASGAIAPAAVKVAATGGTAPGITVTGNSTGNALTLTGNVTAGNVTVSGTSALGIVTATSVTATGNLTAGNITTAGTLSAGANGLPWPAAWDAEVQSECTDALNAYDPPTNAEMEARTLAAAAYFDPAADTVATVTTVTNSGNATLGNNAHQGTSLAISGNLTAGNVTVSGTSALGAVTGSTATFTGNVAAGNITTAGTIVSTLTAAQVNTEADTAISDAALATAAALVTAQTDLDTLTGTDGATLATSQPNYAPATAAAVAALNDVSVADILTTQMTESYAADGAAPTLAQALMLIQQSLGDFAISGTTLTVKKVDGTTTAATFTLDDGTNPTSITRAT